MNDNIKLYIESEGGPLCFTMAPTQALRSLVTTYLKSKWVCEKPPPLELLELRTSDGTLLDVSKNSLDLGLSENQKLNVTFDEDGMKKWKEEKTEKEELEEAEIKSEARRKENLAIVSVSDSPDAQKKFHCTVRNCKDKFAVKNGYTREGQLIKHVSVAHPNSTLAKNYQKDKGSHIQEKTTITSGVAKGWKITGILEECSSATRTHDTQVRWLIEDPKHKQYTRFKSALHESVEGVTSEASFQAIYCTSRTILNKLQRMRKDAEGDKRSRSASLDSVASGGPKRRKLFDEVKSAWTPSDVGKWLLEQPDNDLREAAGVCVNSKISGADLHEWAEGRPNAKILELPVTSRRALRLLLGAKPAFYSCGCSAHLVRRCGNEEIPDTVHLGSLCEGKHTRFYRSGVPGVEGEVGLTAADMAAKASISRRHGFIEPRGTTFVICENDPPSINGIFVNDQKVVMQAFADGQEQRQELKHGDLITFGGIMPKLKQFFQFAFEEAN
eukprot:GEMP01031485.1.p1 GENE.GEMP01031485.1~~GEMP01031485.1.p1  ORF type:complete len:499 (+),score=109.38 GEMP01031485.1:56-1552(+)